MTVIDSSAVIDHLLGTGVADDIHALLVAEEGLAAPDLLVFETVAALRRLVNRGEVTARRAAYALDDLGSLSVELMPAMPLRGRVWELRQNFTAADALYIALAEELHEPFATKDRPLALATAEHTSVEVVHLSALN